MAQAGSAVVPFGGGSTAVVPAGPRRPKSELAIQVAPAKDLAAIVPSRAWDQRNDATASAPPDGEGGLPWRRRLEGALLVALAVLDNALCYATYATVRAFHGRLYDVVDMNLVLLPGLDVALLAFAAVGTLSFLMLVILVECNGLPWFHEIMNFRLYFSALPCGMICTVLVYNTEQTQWAPFTTIMVIVVFVVAWCVHMRVHYSHQLGVLSKIALDVSWFLALLFGAVLAVLFAADALEVITKSDELNCPFADNARMPVRVLTLDRWYCAPWDASGRTEISRAPINAAPVQLTCSDSFVSTFGISIEPHTATCPVGCLATYSGPEVVGCGTYSVDSPICLAAIHAGVLTDQGGGVTVYGRVGVPHFQRCSRNSVTSAERYITRADAAVTLSQPAGGSSTFFAPSAGAGRRLVTAPLVLGADGVQIPQAFHFNNMDSTREFIWLKRFDTVPSKDEGVEADKPWTRVKATISARLAGIELRDERVRLGEHERLPLFGGPQGGQAPGVAPVECRVDAAGVLCEGAGAALVQLDFCRPEAKQCPAEGQQ